MKALLHRAKLIASPLVSVLISGETGSGKSLVAQYIHRQGTRSDGPFLTYDIASRPPSLVDAELLGHVRGAFTGATATSAGVFERANGGTLCLENVQDIPLDKQILLLDPLVTRTVVPIGATRRHAIDVRVLALSSQQLGRAVQLGTFRSDLFYRLTTFPLDLPPLRQRPEDILPLAEAFLEQLSREYARELRLSEPAKRAIVAYEWPGNVTELKNSLERAAILTTDSVIRPDFLFLGGAEIGGTGEASSGLQSQLAQAQGELANLRRSSIAASPIWEGRVFRPDPNLCFVLMPFAEISDVQQVYGEHVRPVVERAGLRCERADDIHDISGVMQSVWEGINRSRIVIAEMTGRNSNVFYELGIAHTLGKPVVMITQSMDYVPFDLKHLRCIKYEYKPRLIRRFEEALEKTLKTVLETGVGRLPLT